jgi:hypothetical protein
MTPRLKFSLVGLGLAAGATAAVMAWASPSERPMGPLPLNWFKSGHDPAAFAAGTDRQIKHGGAQSAIVQSKTHNAFKWTTLMQTASAQGFAGKRVRLRGYVKADKVVGWSGLWLRADGEGEDRRNLAFDNMMDRPILGTKDWKPYDVVLDIPKEATGLAYGLILSGMGTAWIDDVTIEAVGADVPVTRENKQP